MFQGLFPRLLSEFKHYFAFAINEKHVNEYLRLIQSRRACKLSPDNNKTICTVTPSSIRFPFLYQRLNYKYLEQAMVSRSLRSRKFFQISDQYSTLQLFFKFQNTKLNITLISKAPWSNVCISKSQNEKNTIFSYISCQGHTRNICVPSTYAAFPVLIAQRRP